MAMKYDPIMCMMVSDSVKTKDGLDYPEKNAGYEMKKEGQYFKIYKNGKLIGMKSTEEEARREAARHRAANDSNTLDKAIKMCDYAYGTAEIKDVNGKWVVYHDGRYVQEFTNSDDAEAFVREKGWH